MKEYPGREILPITGSLFDLSLVSVITNRSNFLSCTCTYSPSKVALLLTDLALSKTKFNILDFSGVVFTFWCCIHLFLVLYSHCGSDFN